MSEVERPPSVGNRPAVADRRELSGTANLLSSLRSGGEFRTDRVEAARKANAETFLRELDAQSENRHEDVEGYVLGVLADGRPYEVAEIVEKCDGVPLATMLHALGSLQEYGLVFREGEPGADRFRLSPSGLRTSQVMGFRPAVA